MTKSRILSTAASLTLVTAALISVEGFARGDETGRPGHSQQERMTLLERLDSNTDGILTPGEFSDHNAEKAIRKFNKADKDGDAALSVEEFSAAAKRRHHPRLDELDTDAIDSCLEDSLGYALPERPDAETAFAEADSDSDGWVDLDETLTRGELRAAERFAEIDSDGNQQLNSDEIEAYQAARKEQREAHRACVTEQRDENNLLN